MTMICGAGCARRRRLGLDRLLLAALQVARVLRLGSQTLHGVHDVLLLREEGVAQLLRPVELLVHHRQHVRKRDQRLHGRIPGLLLHLLRNGVALDLRMLLGPARGLHDLERIGRGHEDLRQQRVRIQRDGCDDLLQLFGLEWRRLRLSRALRGSRLRLGRTLRLACEATTVQARARPQGSAKSSASARLIPLPRACRRATEVVLATLAQPFGVWYFVNCIEPHLVSDAPDIIARAGLSRTVRFRRPVPSRRVSSSRSAIRWRAVE